MILIMKISGLVILSFGLIIFLLSLVSPNSIVISRKIYIDAPREQVFFTVSQLNLFPKWSPFLENDPHQQYEIIGEDGKIGAHYRWVGVNETSEGIQRLTELNQNESIAFTCEITKPFESKPSFDYRFDVKGNGTLVTQTFRTQLPFPSNIISKLVSLSEKISVTNEKGLKNLKKYIEMKK
ncbi:MAG: SRPBCC family protein [Chloroherpetonaceae bacterium]|nr:SRPBCC family protein [Chloroherpetonaceae bacterium]